jgi:CBS domain-containing protein
MKPIPLTEILSEKAHQEVVTASPDDTVQQAAARMNEHGIGCLLVLEGDQIAGIVTERDCMRHLAGADAEQCAIAKVRQVMSPKVVAVEASYQLDQCLAIMNERRIRHLPVIRDKAVVALVSQGDLVRRVLQDQHDEIQDLADYILDVYPGTPVINPPVSAPASHER